MRAFRYTSAPSEKDAIAAHAASPRARYLGGGTTLLDLMKLHVETPDHLVNVLSVPQGKVVDCGTYVWIGAEVTNSDMAHHALIAKRVPMVSKAILAGASPQIRNMATLAGNLLQRTRCPYFRDTATPCNKRVPGSGCSAIDGYNRPHAILGGSRQCIAAHASDLCVALAAADARVRVQKPDAVRTIEIAKFYRLPGNQPQVENVLEPGDLVLGLEIPTPRWLRFSTYVKVRDRASYAFALASAAVAVELSNGVVQQSRIALGGVGTVPWRSHEAEVSLLGQPLTEENARTAASVALMAAAPRKFNAFKVPLAQQTIVRALMELGRNA